jgi:hypothetical protein
MGSEVLARCRCGVQTRILIGGSRDNFQTTCYFPCLCEQCSAVVQVNLLAEQKRCPQCKTTKVIPYDDSVLSERAGTRLVASWHMARQLGRNLKLTDGDYRCPRCGQMSLHFKDSGLFWD